MIFNQTQQQSELRDSSFSNHVATGTTEQYSNSSHIEPVSSRFIQIESATATAAIDSATPSDDSTIDILLGAQLLNKGIDAINSGQLDKAVTFIEESRSVYQRHSDTAGEMQALSVLSKLSKMLEDTDLFMVVLQQQCDLHRPANQQPDQSDVFSQLDHVYLEISREALENSFTRRVA